MARDLMMFPSWSDLEEKVYLWNKSKKSEKNDFEFGANWDSANISTRFFHILIGYEPEKKSETYNERNSVQFWLQHTDVIRHERVVRCKWIMVPKLTTYIGSYQGFSLNHPINLKDGLSRWCLDLILGQYVHTVRVWWLLT